MEGIIKREKNSREQMEDRKRIKENIDAEVTPACRYVTHATLYR